MNGAQTSGEKMPGASGDLPPCSTEKAGCVSGRGPRSVAKYATCLVVGIAICGGTGALSAALWPGSLWPFAIVFPVCLIVGMTLEALRKRWLW